MNALRLYGRYAAASIVGQMQYPGAFLLQAVAQFTNTLVGFVESGRCSRASAISPAGAWAKSRCFTGR